MTVIMPGIYHSGIQSIAAVARMHSLTTLTVGCCPAIRSWAALAHCHQLRILGVEYDSPCDEPQCASVHVFGQLTELRELNLRNWGALSDIAPLSNCQKLEILELPNSAVQDLTPVSSCSQLQMLNLFGCKQLLDVSPLARLPCLHTLDLTEGAAAISGLEWVKDCRRAIEVSGVLMF